MKSRRRMILLLMIVAFLGGSMSAYAQKSSRSLTLLYSNNINGEIEPCPTWGQKNKLGGLAKRAAWIEEVRAGAKEMLVLDAGDLLFRKSVGPLPEQEVKMASEKAHMIVECLSRMGYDAAGIGDDDLALGKDFLLEAAKKSGFPFLSSNVLNEETGKPLFQPYLIKEVNGLRIGILSLLSPDFFSGGMEGRRKGLIIQPPFEAAQNAVKELLPKTDLILLLSHLGYAKDVELAQNIQGIHIIVGSHTGINLSNPPVIKNTIILQSTSKGMYGGRLDLSLSGKQSGFYNVSTKRSLENNLNGYKSRIATSSNASEAEKSQWRTAKEGIEKQLQQFQGKSEFTNTLTPFTEEMKDHVEIGKTIEAFKTKFAEPKAPEAVKTAPPK